MGVLSTSKEIENFKISQEINRFKIPIFQSSNFPKKPKKPKKQKKQFCTEYGGKRGEAKSWHNCFFFVFLVSLVFLENWNFGKLEFWKLPLGEGGGWEYCLLPRKLKILTYPRK